MGFKSIGAIALLAGAMILATLGNASAEALKGRYYGVDEATGAAIEIKPDSGGYEGAFFDPKGKRQKFKADRHGDVAETVLDMDGRTVLVEDHARALRRRRATDPD